MFSCVWPNRRRSMRISTAGRSAELRVAMRYVYVREGEFSGATRGFLWDGSVRVETIFNELLCDYNGLKVGDDARSAWKDADRRRQ